MITSLDYGVGRLTSALEKIHQLNETIIIFLSDNGGKSTAQTILPHKLSQTKDRGIITYQIV